MTRIGDDAGPLQFDAGDFGAGVGEDAFGNDGGCRLTAKVFAEPNKKETV